MYFHKLLTIFTEKKIVSKNFTHFFSIPVINKSIPSLHTKIWMSPVPTNKNFKICEPLRKNVIILYLYN